MLSWPSIFWANNWKFYFNHTFSWHKLFDESFFNLYWRIRIFIEEAGKNWYVGSFFPWPFCLVLYLNLDDFYSTWNKGNWFCVVKDNCSFLREMFPVKVSVASIFVLSWLFSGSCVDYFFTKVCFQELFCHFCKLWAFGFDFAKIR